MNVSRETMDKIIGHPWRLVNVADFLVIGSMSLLFLLMLQIMGMAWHRFNLLRMTGSAQSPAQMLHTKSLYQSDTTETAIPVNTSGVET